jgi:HEAT repeat protein
MIVTEEQLARHLAELEPAWINRPNPFAELIAQGDGAGLMVKLDDPSPEIRADAAEALGLLKERAAIAKLTQLTRDLYPRVRRAAAVALVVLADEPMLQKFVKALSDRNPAVVAGAAIALGEAGFKESVPFLLKAYRTEHPRIAGAVAVALGRLGHLEAAPWLIAALKSGLAPVEAAEALGRVGDPAAARILVEQLTHHYPPLRAASARALGLLASARAWDPALKQTVIAALHSAILDPDQRVKLGAIEALAQFGDPTSTT